MQLDLFEHSRDLMLRNDVLQALEQRDAAAARQAWCRLQSQYAGDRALAALLSLVTALEQPQQGCFASTAEAAAALDALQHTVVAAAQQLWPAATARAWLAPLWARLAERAAPLPYSADASELHAAALWLRAGHFEHAALAVAGIASWRRIPAPLAWMAQACCRRDGVDAHWALLAELAWLSPQRLDALCRSLADPVLDPLRRRFDAGFEGDGDVHDLAWFPAWLLCERPALAARLGQAGQGLQQPPERAMRLLLDLLHLERQGRQHDLPARRRQLRELHPALFAHYMKTR